MLWPPLCGLAVGESTKHRNHRPTRKQRLPGNDGRAHLLALAERAGGPRDLRGDHARGVRPGHGGGLARLRQRRCLESVVHSQIPCLRGPFQSVESDPPAGVPASAPPAIAARAAKSIVVFYVTSTSVGLSPECH